MYDDFSNNGLTGDRAHYGQSFEGISPEEITDAEQEVLQHFKTSLGDGIKAQLPEGYTVRAQYSVKEGLDDVLLLTVWVMCPNGRTIQFNLPPEKEFSSEETTIEERDKLVADTSKEFIAATVMQMMSETQPMNSDWEPVAS